MINRSFITPNWPASNRVRAFSTTRQGGGSRTPYASFNLATHVGDDAGDVWANRNELKKLLQMPETVYWLDQVHGNRVLALDNLPFPTSGLQADGCWASSAQKVCLVQTADCLPILLCDQAGTCVAALHAGRQGLALGIIAEGVKAMPVAPHHLMAWLGPGISSTAYEVGEEVRQQFLALSRDTQSAFKPSTRPEHWYMDLFLIARQQLQSLGVNAIYGGDRCTYQQAEYFFSYRREGITGRMASLIWLESI